MFLKIFRLMSFQFVSHWCNFVSILSYYYRIKLLIKSFIYRIYYILIFEILFIKNSLYVRFHLRNLLNYFRVILKICLSVRSPFCSFDWMSINISLFVLFFVRLFPLFVNYFSLMDSLSLFLVIFFSPQFLF